MESPGTSRVPPNTTLNHAKLNVGGFRDNRVCGSTVALIRLNPNGTISREKVGVDFAQGANENSNPILRDNDIVVVSPFNAARVTDALGLLLDSTPRLIYCFRSSEFDDDRSETLSPGM